MSRKVYDFNRNWEFCIAGDKVWEQVCLPHTWTVTDRGEDNRYYQGEGIYRKQVDFSEFPCEKKRVFLEFGAANTVAELYINDSFAGKHEGGYSAFRFEVTEYIMPNKINQLVVKVNNAPTTYIAPIDDQGDFTKMGGLYRDVNLIITEDVHIDLMDYGSSGVYITPRPIKKGRAEVDILVKVKNDDKKERTVTVTSDVYDGEERFMTSCCKTVQLLPGEVQTVQLAVFFANPVLWDGRRNPYLYKAEIRVREGAKEWDGSTQKFGIRTYHIDPQKGFYLNGEYLDLHGVNYHQDSWENGWAMTEEQRQRDYKMMADLGCTAVRMAHYQHAPQEYDLCDELGLCVWTEIGIVNKMSAGSAERPRVASGF